MIVDKGSESAKRLVRSHETLSWLNERAWPLAGVAVFTTVIYLNAYIVHEQVPLSITSSAMLTALPTLLAMLLLVVTLLTAFSLMPLIILFTKFNDRDGALADHLIGHENKRDETIQLRMRMLWLWLFGLSVIFLALLIAVYIFSLKTYPYGIRLTASLAVTLIAVVMFTGVVVVRPLPQAVSWRNFSGEFWFSCLTSGCVQVLLTLYVIVFASKLANRYFTNGDFSFLAGAVIGVLGIWILQVASAMLLIALTRHRNPIRLAGTAAAIAIVLLGLIPPLGGPIAGYAFAMTASGGKSCVVISWQPGMEVASLSDSDLSDTTRKLKILAEIDGVFLVRPWRTDSKDVFFVERSRVQKLSECLKQDAGESTTNSNL